MLGATTTTTTCKNDRIVVAVRSKSIKTTLFLIGKKIYWKGMISSDGGGATASFS